METRSVGYIYTYRTAFIFLTHNLHCSISCKRVKSFFELRNCVACVADASMQRVLDRGLGHGGEARAWRGSWVANLGSKGGSSMWGRGWVAVKVNVGW